MSVLTKSGTVELSGLHVRVMCLPIIVTQAHVLILIMMRKISRKFFIVKRGGKCNVLINRL